MAPPVAMSSRSATSIKRMSCNSGMARASPAWRNRRLQRNEFNVGIAERLGADDFQGLGRLHQIMRGNADHRELLPVAQHFGRDRLTGLEFEIHDEIGHDDLGLAIDEQYEVLILDRDQRLGPRVVAEALEPRFAPREAAAQF